jgi:hypothetical protein
MKQRGVIFPLVDSDISIRCLIVLTLVATEQKVSGKSKIARGVRGALFSLVGNCVIRADNQTQTGLIGLVCSAPLYQLHRAVTQLGKRRGTAF